MDTNFETVWDTLSSLNRIPQDINEEVNIIKGASPDFINFVADLECMLDFKARAVKAKQYIDNNDGLKEISYVDLGNYLTNIKSLPLPEWRKLYMLERSIPPRFGDNYTWMQRLRLFYDTFLHETNIHGCTFKLDPEDNKNYKLYLKHGNKDNPTNHDKLVYGHGQGKTDFYFYTDRMVDVEYKYSNEGSLSQAIKKYADGKYTYGAEWLLFFMSNVKKYYLVKPGGKVTYTDLGEVKSVEDIIIPLNLEAPQGLLKI